MSIIADCPPGMKSNSENFCYACLAGTAGPLCQPCPPGYVCPDNGMAVSTQLCTSGFYCPAGTKYFTNINVSSEGAPIPCTAGTYCPAGVAVANISDDLNSPRSCAVGYYCPMQSKVPNDSPCPSHTTSNISAESISDCYCLEGYFGFGGSCLQCPSDCYCFQNIISSCYLPIDISQNDLSDQKIHPVECPAYTIGGRNPCNPGLLGWEGGGQPFPCEKGYSDRLCSKCQNGYFLNGRECGECDSQLYWQLPLSYFFIAVAVLLYAWHVPPGGSAVLKIITFHFQSLYILLVSGIRWQMLGTHLMTRFLSTSSFSLVAIECILPWWNILASLIFAILMPLVLAFLAFIATLVGVLYHKLQKSPNWEWSYFKTRGAKVFAITLSLGYFGIVVNVSQMFGCTGEDPLTGKHFLNVHPWVECVTKKWDIYLFFALVGLIVEVIGFPVFVLLRLRSFHDNLEDLWVRQVYGSFYCIYTSSNYYWEIIVVSRRILTAVLVALVPYSNPILLTGYVVVVVGYMMVQIHKNPYIRLIDNILDSVSHFVLLCTIVIGLLVEISTFSPYRGGLTVLVLVLNFTFVVLSIACIIESYHQRISALGLRVKLIFRKKNIEEDQSLLLEPKR